MSTRAEKVPMSARAELRRNCEFYGNARNCLGKHARNCEFYGNAGRLQKLVVDLVHDVKRH
eukprot:gene93-143_t